MTNQDLNAIHRKAIKDGMVKIAIPSNEPAGVIERCFAERVSATHARIANIPMFCSHVNFADVVEFAELDPPHPLFKAFVRVKTQGSKCLTFACVPQRFLHRLSDKQLLARARRVLRQLCSAPTHLRPLGSEGVGPGWLAAAWPAGTDIAEVSDFLDSLIEM